MVQRKITEFEDYYEKFEKMQHWMINDLRNACIKAKANLLVGMGIFNYIEILGGFYHYNENNGYAKRRFDFVFGQLMNQYSKIYNELKMRTRKGAYDVLRCGLTHEYLIKVYKMKDIEKTMHFTIYGVEDEVQYTQTVLSRDLGVELITLDQNHFHLRIYIPRMIYDLNIAFEAYKSSLRANATSANDTESFRDKFIQRCKNINFKDFN